MYTAKTRFESKDPGIIISAADPKYKIYLITMEKSSQFSNTLNSGVSDMSKLTGIPYIWVAPAQRDADEQIKAIENAISSGANAIMLAAIDGIKESRAVEDAKALGVKMIYVDSPTSEPAIITLATDNYSAGVTAGQTMISFLNDLGKKSGTIGMISVTPQTPTTILREAGFLDTMRDDGRFTILKTKYSGNNRVLAQWYAQAFLSEYLDIVGIYATNEITTFGVGNAIKNSQKEIVGIGFDINKAIQDFLDEGYLKAVMIQNPYTMGYLGMAQTIAALKGYDTGPTFLNTGITVHTKDTY